MKTKDLVIALLVVIIWGANFTVIRLGLNGVPPLLLVSLRFSLAAFPAVLFIKRPELPFIHLLMYGFSVGIGQFACLFYAIHIGMPAGVASVVLQAQAFFTMLFAVILLGESVSFRHLAGLVLAATGLYLVTGGSISATTIPLAALLLTLGGAAFWGISNIVVRKATLAAAAQGKKIDMLSLVVWSSLVPPVPLLLCSLLLDSPAAVVRTLTHLHALSLFSIAYLAFAATLFGYGAWSYLLARYPANRVAPLSLLVPVAGLVTAQIVLAEHLVFVQWAGCLLVVLGLLLAFFNLPRKKILHCS
ncbi:O-acetylserine/cysteine exporter [Desulfopila sp. IMCC35006]|uniref:EamA family transporter n=1 Tax=Desulfopila sp. IMCC35006 TaxID=2569542 RepID=UPI0010AC5EAB|nr:EamA family transporter [Desulfopila sp. IMCC35006]TKB25120.1 O-acetylserine/cysteine exporter [Desulfopila sp. IMCC35006]